jgi:hypothetical protein
MQLTGPNMCSRPVMPIPLKINIQVFEARQGLLEWPNHTIDLFVHLLLLSLFSTGIYRMIGNSSMRLQINEVRVPAIVFDYPRHSGATDKEMTQGSSILAYLVFGPGRASTEGMTGPINTISWRGPGMRLGVQGKISKNKTYSN